MGRLKVGVLLVEGTGLAGVEVPEDDAEGLAGAELEEAAAA